MRISARGKMQEYKTVYPHVVNVVLPLKEKHIPSSSDKTESKGQKVLDICVLHFLLNATLHLSLILNYPTFKI